MPPDADPGADPIGLASWLENKARETRLQACGHGLNRFRAAADGDPRYTALVGEAVWEFLLSTQGCVEDPLPLLARIRKRLTELRPDQLDALSRKLEGGTNDAGDVRRDAGKLVSGWFRCIAVSKAAPAYADRASHLARSYERTFAALARLMNHEPAAPPRSAA